MKKTILSDRPLTALDQDRLGYSDFAEGIAEAICMVRAEEGMVFGLFAPWGAGKTTCLNFIVRHIENREQADRPYILHFNPWWFSQDRDIIGQFFRELSVSLAGKDKMKKIAGLMMQLGKAVAEDSADGAGPVTRLFGGSRRPGPQVGELREQIAGMLARTGRKILVIIDDIDRLTDRQMKDLFRAIRAIADFPYLVYLLSFDKAVVAKALEKGQDLSGEQYLEKFIQVPYELPLSDRLSLRNYFLEQINLIIRDTPGNLWDSAYWGSIYWDGIDHFLRSIRDIKRITNAVKVNYPAVESEVNPVDFIAVEALRVFAPDVYYAIRNNADLFAGIYSLSYQERERGKEFHEALLLRTPDGDREAIRGLLTRLFPKYESTFTNSVYTHENLAQWRRQLRVCSPVVFQTYFKFGLPQGEMANGEMQAILSTADNARAFGQKLLELSQRHRTSGATMAGAFLDRLADYTEDEIPRESIPNILLAFMEVGDSLPGDEEINDFFIVSNQTRMRRIFFQLMKRYDTPGERYGVIRDLFEKGRSLAMMALVVATLGKQAGRFKAIQYYTTGDFATAQQLGELEAMTLSRIKAAASDRGILHTPCLDQVLYVWSELEGPDAVGQWSAGSGILDRDEDIAVLLSAFATRTKGREMENGAAAGICRLSPKALEPYFDAGMLMERCRNMIRQSPPWLTGERRTAVEALVREYRELG